MLSISDKRAFSMSADCSCEHSVSEVSWRGHCSSVTSSTAQPDVVLQWGVIKPSWSGCGPETQDVQMQLLNQSDLFHKRCFAAFIIFPYRLFSWVSYIAKPAQLLVKVTLAELEVNHQNGRWMKLKKQRKTVKERKNSFALLVFFRILAEIHL